MLFPLKGVKVKTKNSLEPYFSLISSNILNQDRLQLTKFLRASSLKSLDL